MKRYYCDLCSYETGSRKLIRKHAKTVHGLKGRTGRGMQKERESAISNSYHSKEVEV